MSGTEIALIVVAVVVVLAVVGVVLVQSRRQRELKETFGPEYDRTVEEAGGRRAATRELSDRQQRYEQLDIQPLDDEARRDYALAWRDTQERFVDAPRLALVEADHLITRVMEERGYPVTDDFDQRARDLSVEHAQVLDHYRSAHDIYRRSEHDEVTTEDLREAMVHYRALFADLVEHDQLSSH